MMRAPLALALILLAGIAQPLAVAAAELRGRLAPQGVAGLPTDAEITISLRETDGPGRLGRKLAQTTFRPSGAGPHDFVLTYPPDALRGGRGHALAVRVTQQGRVTWQNAGRVAVDAANPSRPLRVRLVATAATGSAAAKQMTAPAQAVDSPRSEVAREVAPAASAPSAMRCQGNEPGWLLLSHAGQARFSTQDSPGRETMMPAQYSSAPWAETPFGMLRAELPDSGTLVAFITAETCLDSMSGAAFPLRARLSMPDGAVRVGCCRPVHPEPDPRRADDWSQNLSALLPVVRACAALRPGAILAAWPMNHGKAGVRIAGRDGDRFDCVADLGTRRVERITQVAHADRQAREGRPTLRLGQPSGPEACRLVEPVHGPDGTLLGSLAWETCL